MWLEYRIAIGRQLWSYAGRDVGAALDFTVRRVNLRPSRCARCQALQDQPQTLRDGHQTIVRTLDIIRATIAIFVLKTSTRQMVGAAELFDSSRPSFSSHE